MKTMRDMPAILAIAVVRNSIGRMALQSPPMR